MQMMIEYFIIKFPVDNIIRIDSQIPFMITNLTRYARM